MAAGDIVSGTVIQSSVALMLFSLADVLFKFFAVVLFRKVPLLPPLLIIIGIIWFTAYLLLVAFDQVNLRLVSAFLVGAGNGLSNIMAMLLIARSNNAEAFSSAFQGGLNTATLVIALLYTGNVLENIVNSTKTLKFSFA